MSAILNLRDVSDTQLWKRLSTSFAATQHHDAASQLAANLPDICAEASARMKAFPALHPEYTLHDETHLLRVPEIMALVLDQTIAELNPAEIGLLILAAYSHDQGMVLDDGDMEKMDADPDFGVFRGTWEADHPNLRDIRRQIGTQPPPEEETRYRAADAELRLALISDYLRGTHGTRSRDFVQTTYGSDPRWRLTGASVAPLVARLCESHSLPTESITPSNGFHYDEQVGMFTVNMAYLALVLRLADILDLDRERTPDALYRTIHFTNTVSVQEWAKHRQVEGWTIGPDMVRFTMDCDHPVYQRVALQFMDLIDDELSRAHQAANAFPAPFSQYRLHLPTRVNRDRIRPRDDAYIYHDLEFSLSRDEVVAVLMGVDLYSDPGLCVRELLQNSLDALRHRKAIHMRDDATEWTEGRVSMEHGLDEHGREFVRCVDNGVGMDEDIITRFLTSAGRSYYRSPEFERERVTLRQAGVDFDPCARFGIGFMSCFMLGDEIEVRTRRDYGPKVGYGSPLIVEISGLGGLVVIRRGADEQPIGTSVTLVQRDRQPFHTEFSDRIKLLDRADGYALACEFPVEARCTVPDIEGHVQVPPVVAVRHTEMEDAGLTDIVSFEQAFSELAPELQGQYRESFLRDGSGHPATENAEARWAPDEKGRYQLYKTEKQIALGLGSLGSAVCVDGILIGGHPGRQRESGLGWRSTPIGDRDSGVFVLNARGSLKPPLTPARTAPDRVFRHEPGGWRRLRRLVGLARGRIWERVAEEVANDSTGEMFWRLALAYGAQPEFMRTAHIWSFLKFPLRTTTGEQIFLPASSLGPLRILKEADKNYRITTADGAVLGIHPELAAWARHQRTGSEEDEKPIDLVVQTLVGISRLSLMEDGLVLLVDSPEEGCRAPIERLLTFDIIGVRLIPYEGQMAQMLSTKLPFVNANLRHPISQIALGAEHTDEHTDLETFARSLMNLELEADDLSPEAGRSEGKVHFRRYLGHRYRGIDWSQTHSDCAPPYRLWIDGVGEVQVSAETLDDWADGKPGSIG
ncbi:MAG: ATP-binding protein [Armatimonadetes bacterium]|nr:ATP-binding protein [Armatimonadota bacterium]